MPKPPYPVSRAGRDPRPSAGLTTNIRTVVPSAEVTSRCSISTGGTGTAPGAASSRTVSPVVEVEAAHLLRRDEVGPADPQPALLRGTGRVGRGHPGQRPEPGQRDGGARRAVPVVQRRPRRWRGGCGRARAGRRLGRRSRRAAATPRPPARSRVLGDQLPPVLAAGRGGIGDGEAEAGGAVGGEQVQPAVALHPRGAPHVVGLGEQRDEGAGAVQVGDPQAVAAGGADIRRDDQPAAVVGDVDAVVVVLLVAEFAPR